MCGRFYVDTQLEREIWELVRELGWEAPGGCPERGKAAAAAEEDMVSASAKAAAQAGLGGRQDVCPSQEAGILRKKDGNIEPGRRALWKNGPSGRVCCAGAV